MIASHQSEGVARVPGPPLRRIVPTLMDLRRDLLEFSVGMYKNYGEFAAFHMGRKKAFMLAHPRDFRYVLCENPGNYQKGLGLSDASPLFGKGLLTSDGEIWSRSRDALQAAFQKKELQRYAQVMAQAAVNKLDRWRGEGEDPKVVNIADELTLLTLEILSRTLLRHDFGDLTAQVAGDLRTVIAWAILHLKAILPLPLHWPSPANLNASRALKRLDALVDHLLQRHLHPAGQDTPDLFDLLLAQLGPNLDAKVLHQVRDEIMTFLLVGHETTAAMMCWTIYLICRHPQVRERLETELEQVLGGAAPRFEDLPALTYTRAVLEESARLYPPVWMLPRLAIQADRIRGFEIPAGSEVLLNAYSMHRHPEFWAEPECFNPARFISGITRETMTAWMPFGAGARTCIGSRFGMMEATIVLAILLQSCHVELVSDAPPRPDAGLTLRPQGGLLVRVHRRHPKPAVKTNGLQAASEPLTSVPNAS